MMLLRQVRKILQITGLVLFISTAIFLSFGSEKSWATTSRIRIINQPQAQFATMNRVEAMKKNIEGKTQETIGNMTGDPKDQMMGKAKQVESQNRNLKQAEDQARNAAKDMKEQVTLKGKSKAIAKNIEGKVQEASGKATGNLKDQVDGRAKQAESQARNAVEDVKDKVQEALN